MQIHDLELSVSTWQCLKNNNIHTVEQLRDMTESEVRNLDQLSNSNFRNVEQALRFQGWTFKEEGE